MHGQNGASGQVEDPEGNRKRLTSYRSRRQASPAAFSLPPRPHLEIDSDQFDDETPSARRVVLKPSQRRMLYVIGTNGPFSVERLAEEFAYLTVPNVVELANSLKSLGLIEEGTWGIDLVDADKKQSRSSLDLARESISEHESRRVGHVPRMDPECSGVVAPPFNLDKRTFRVHRARASAETLTKPAAKFLSTTTGSRIEGRIARLAGLSGLTYRETLKALIELASRGFVEDLDPGALRRALRWQEKCELVIAALVPGERVSISCVESRLRDLDFKDVKGALMHGVFNGLVSQTTAGASTLFELTPHQTPRQPSPAELRRSLTGTIRTILEMIDSRPSTAQIIQATTGVTRQRVDQLLSKLCSLKLVKRVNTKGRTHFLYVSADMEEQDIAQEMRKLSIEAYPDGLLDAVHAAASPGMPVDLDSFCIREKLSCHLVESFLATEARAGRLAFRGGAFALAEHNVLLSRFCFALDSAYRDLMGKAATLGTFTTASLSEGSQSVRPFLVCAQQEGLIAKEDLGRRMFGQLIQYRITAEGLEVSKFLSDPTLSQTRVFYSRRGRKAGSVAKQVQHIKADAALRQLAVDALKRSSHNLKAAAAEMGVEPIALSGFSRVLKSRNGARKRPVKAGSRPAVILSVIRDLGTANCREIEAAARQISDDVPKTFKPMVFQAVSQLNRAGFVERTESRRAYTYTLTEKGRDYVSSNDLGCRRLDKTFS